MKEKEHILFSEVVKVLDGKYLDMSYHLARMDKTMHAFFNTSIHIELREEDIPKELQLGLTKCRILYSCDDIKIEYERYNFKGIKTLKLVKDNAINYAYKYANRGRFDHLLDKKGECDDILIIKNGLITDTSFTNIVLENEDGLFTPTSYLLEGTKRRALLETGRIKETIVKPEDLGNYSKLYLINAMITLEDNISIPTSSVI